MPRLNVIVASTRPGRVGPRIADWFGQTAREHAGFEVVVTDLAELKLPMLDEPSPAVEGEPYVHEHTRGWSAIVDAADAFVFVMPEYNQGYPASLKNALDYLYTEWHHKPAGFVSYGMTSGGLRAQQGLKPVLSALKMMPVLETVVVHLRQTIDSEGRLTPTPAMASAAKDLLDELELLADVLKTVRV